MNTFGKRLQSLRKSKNLSQQTVADATGMHRSRISELEKDKVDDPRDDTIEKLATYFDCNPIWLKTGKGSFIFNEEKANPDNLKHIPTGKRLEYLKGNLSTKEFAHRCKVPTKEMEVYLNGARMTNEHCYKIATAFNTSLGWLTCGEAWQSPQKKYTGFTIEKHTKIAEELRKTERFINKLSSDLEFSYPLSGYLSQPLKDSLACKHHIEGLKSNLEANMFDDHPQKASTQTYYNVDSRLKEKEKKQVEENEKASLLEHLSDFIDETYADTTGIIDFLDELRDTLPEYNEWRRARKEKKQVTGTDN